MKRRIAAIVACVAVGVAGCASDDSDKHGHDAGSDAHTHIDPLDPEHLSAAETAETAMQTILSWQPAVDASKSDALRRAEPWLGGDLAATVGRDSGPPPAVRPDREWSAWRAAGDALTASCTEADTSPAAPDGMRTVVIDVDCRQRVLHASGSSTTRGSETWRTTVTRTDAGWRLTDFRYQ